MGLFALPLGKTKKEHIQSLAANCKLWLEYSDGPYDMDYLLTTMQMCLDAAKKSKE